MKLNPELELQLQKHLAQAHTDGFEIFSIEHLVKVCLSTDRVKTLTQQLGIPVKELNQKLEAYIEKNIPKLADDNAGIAPIMSIGAQRMLQSSWHHGLNSGKTQVQAEDLLVSLFAEEESFALHLFENDYSLTRLRLINEISHGNSKLGAENLDPLEDNFKGAIDSFCRQWDSESSEAIEEFIGRDYLLKRMVQILSRKTRNNPLLVGESGVGKSALALNLAKKMAQEDVPKNLKNLEFYELNLSKLMAGAKFRGELEERTAQLYQELAGSPPKVLFVDDIASLLNTGNSGGGGLDISHMLRPFLEDERIHMIACCNFKDYKNNFEKNSYMNRFFQKMEVEECSKEEAFEILKSKAKSFEKFHKLKIPEPCLLKSIELASRYLSSKRLPDSAIDLIDESSAREKLSQSPSTEVSIDGMSSVVSDMSGVSTENLGSSQGSKLKELEPNIKLKIYGQDKAVETLVGAVKFSFAGLTKPNKPIGSYLFAGPTGVGKTELAIQLAEQLGLYFEKFDMSEYLEKHSVARLLGAPPGYVGYEEGGLLTDAISKHPHSVILMDEIEKAHPDLINIFLQIMDSGSLTDANGKKVDCRNIILIMTSNAGSKDQSKASIGIAPSTAGHFDQAKLKNFFSPEFLNRLSSIIAFRPLSKEILYKVADKFLSELVDQLQIKKVNLSYTKELVEHIVTEAYDPQYGARPIARTIDSLVKKPLVDELLYGKLSEGGNLELSLSKDKIDFRFS